MKISKAEILKEIGNIGTGNAATALSQMINKKVIIDVPQVEFVDIEVIKKAFAEDKEDIFISIEIKEALEGNVFVKLDDESADKLFNAASQGLAIPKDSLLKELSNILAGSYINALGTMMNAFINISPPDLWEKGSDKAKKVNLDHYAPEVAFIKTAMMIDEEKIFCDFILMMTPASLKFLLERVMS